MLFSHRSDNVLRALRRGKRASLSATFLRYRWGNLRSALTFIGNVLWIYITALLTWLLVQLIVGVLFGIYGGNSSLVFGFLIFVPFFFPRVQGAFQTFRSSIARNATSLFDVDPRPQVLFLRSFAADDLHVYRRRTTAEKLYGLKSDIVPLEQTLVETAFRYGPVGALHNPDVSLRPLGAARDLSPQSGWREYISEKLQSTQHVVCVIAETSGLQWEIDRAFDLDVIDKFIFIFPPRWHIHADNKHLHERLLDTVDLNIPHSKDLVALFFLTPSDAIIEVVWEIRTGS